MSKLTSLTAIRGMNDILPSDTMLWQHVEAVLQKIGQSYGYQEIRLPLVEKAALFERSIGASTDIVEKEMYTFADRNEELLALRPEGTAGCVRAGIEHGLLYNQTQRLWYKGSMFRHERPQRGRYRQFQQYGVEAFGFVGPDIDAELILMTVRLWRNLGIEHALSLELNSLGDYADRQQHRTALVAYFTEHQAKLDEDSQRRLNTNPLRILDSKNPAMARLIQNAPKLYDFWSEAAKAHFEELCARLTAAGVSYQLNPCLVRGLDYYNRTVFEWTTTELGAQGTVCGGGRYDSLVESLGGHACYAAGFAIGLERLVELLRVQPHATLATSVDAYIIAVGSAAQQQGQVLSETWREALPGLKIMLHCGGGDFKKQFKAADKSGARFALVLGEDEIAKQTVTVKFLRESQEQMNVTQAELTALLSGLLN